MRSHKKQVDAKPLRAGSAYSTQAAIALVLARDRTGSSLSKLKVDVKTHEKAAAELEARLRGDDPFFDFVCDSLQNRLLKFFESELGFCGARKQLQIADEGRRALLCEVERAGLLGLHAGNKELEKLVEGFANYDLHLLNVAVLNNKPSVLLKTPEIAEVIIRNLREGRGEDVIKYVASRLEHHQSRMRSSAKRTMVEVVNPALIVVARMWTDPNCPMWLMPSAAAVQLIEDNTPARLTTSAYNSLIKIHHLQRVPQPVLDKFMSITRKDPRCNRLRQEFEEAAGIHLAQVRRGRRRTPKAMELGIRMKKET